VVHRERNTPTCSSILFPPGREVLAQGLVLDGVPPDAHAQAERATGQQVDLGGLLGHQHGRSLGEDGDAGDQFERRAGGEVAEQHERLVERGVDVVGTAPVWVHGRIRSHHVVVGHHVPVAEFLHALAIGTDAADVGTDLRLGEYHADIHDTTTPIIQAGNRPAAGPTHPMAVIR
jgi:hypothetical protein